jgi:PAS domain S-box-containing protein
MTWLSDLLRRFIPRAPEDHAIAALLAEKIARVRAEASERRGAFLVEASQVLFSSLEYEATLGSVARMAVPYLADWCAVDLVQPDGSVHRVAVAHADPTKIQGALDVTWRYPVDPEAPYGSAKVLRTGRSEVYREVTDEMLVAVAQDAAHLETLRQAGLTSGMCVPLAAGGRTLGTMSFGWTRVTRAYGADDLALAEELALRAAQAVDNARLYDELRHREGRQRAMLETAPDCIITVDADGRIVDLNPAAERTFGLARDAVGRDLVELIVPPALRDAHRQGLRRYLETGQTRLMGRRVEMPALRADGSQFPVELAVTRVSVAEPPLFTAYIRDLSDRKKSEEAATLRSVSALAAAAAHEINNPLCVVVAQASLLALEAGVPLGRVDAIRDAAARIAQVVTDMSQIVSLEQVPSRPHLPDMLDLRGSTDPTRKNA